MEKLLDLLKKALGFYLYGPVSWIYSSLNEIIHRSFLFTSKNHWSCRKSVLDINLSEQISSRIIVLLTVFYSNHIRNNHDLFVQHFVNPKVVLQNQGHNLSTRHLNDLNFILLKKLLSFIKVSILFWLIVNPKYYVLWGSLWQRNLLKFSRLRLGIQVAWIYRKTCEWWYQNLLFFLIFWEFLNTFPMLNFECQNCPLLIRKLLRNIHVSRSWCKGIHSN